MLFGLVILFLRTCTRDRTAKKKKATNGKIFKAQKNGAI